MNGGLATVAIKAALASILTAIAAFTKGRTVRRIAALLAILESRSGEVDDNFKNRVREALKGCKITVESSGERASFAISSSKLTSLSPCEPAVCWVHAQNAQ